MRRMRFRLIGLKNLLSFRDLTLDLRPLNVLIGPNGCGKTNLIEAIGLLQALPGDLGSTLLRGGPMPEWIWCGTTPRPSAVLMEFSTEGEPEFRYHLELGAAGPQAVIMEEQLEANDRDRPVFSRSANRLDFPAQPDAKLENRTISALKYLGNPVLSPAIDSLARSLEAIRIYRDWDTSTASPVRRGIHTSVLSEQLDEGGHNLALVLHNLDGSAARDNIEVYLGRVLEGFKKLYTPIEAGLIRVHLGEAGLQNRVPASRLSDGTLRSICLMTALLDPNPPPLICIEEPEVGLHPDALHVVAEALVEASEHTQLIVTTHSPDLVDALPPESIVVCEKEADSSTSLRRLEPGRLTEWLEEYRLGELWRKGEIGGNRW